MNKNKRMKPMIMLMQKQKAKVKMKVNSKMIKAKIIVINLIDKIEEIFNPTK